MLDLNLAKVGVSFRTKNIETSPRIKEWKKHISSYKSLLSQKNLEYKYLNGSRFETNNKSVDYIDIQESLNSSIIKNPSMLWIPCMDERIQYLTTTAGSLSMGLPGCECLLTSKEKLNIAKEIIATIKQNPSIEEIVVTSHDSCGAVQKAIKDNASKNINIIKKIKSSINKLDKKFCDKTAKKYSRSFARILIDELKTNDMDVYVNTLHMTHDHLHCPNFHNTVGAVINYLPSLNPSLLIQKLHLPLFNIYANSICQKSIIDNTKLAIQIAQSKHGFNNEFFNNQNPFIILIPYRQENIDDKESIQKLLDNISIEKFDIPVIYSLLPTHA